MRTILFLLATAAFTGTAQAQAMKCVKSQNVNEKRLVPARVACGGVSTNAAALLFFQPFQVPDVSDRGDSTPGAFRLAYFYPDRTDAFYTSCSGAGLATIQRSVPIQPCR
ncbi:hypothetical protein GA0061099_1001234 [Bradyrhizobium yuanmingense]|uniref:Secreted protein n=1 Tax=Bradyrhizobium yuanmingense TaxID=108015 RepID=A0A1C3TYN9_9BRAD|nr:hypothetical protein IQ15_01526 [Bradyrhizobium yuanmingense]SCB08334.1 hypothetical protein GA0061099_1001234 [Bradyrhizobium yuanmingense]